MPSLVPILVVAVLLVAAIKALDWLLSPFLLPLVGILAVSYVIEAVKRKRGL